MIRIRIGNSERELSDISPEWINQQIRKRRADGISVCVQVIINNNTANIVLSTPTCNSGGGLGRPLNKEEKVLVSIWDKLHLNTQKFSGGNLVAFLKQIS